MAELVEHGEIVERRVPSHIVQIPQKRRTGHRHEDRMPPPKPHVMGRVARVVGEVGRDRLDQLAHQSAIQMHPITAHISAHTFPIGQSDIIAKDDAHVFEDIHRGGVDPFDL